MGISRMLGIKTGGHVSDFVSLLSALFSVDERLGVRDAIISGDKKKLDGDPLDGDTSLGSLLFGLDQLSPKLGGGGG